MVTSGDVVYELWGRSSTNDELTGKIVLGDASSYGLHATEISACRHGDKLVEDETITHYTINKRRIH